MELPGSARTPIPGARAIGQPRAEGRLEVTLFLRRRSEVAPSADGAGPAPGATSEALPLSREDFARTHGAHPDDLTRVREFATARKLEVRAESIGPRLVRLGGTVEAFEQAFGVALERWVFSGGTYRGRVGPIQLPPELDGIVLGVFGLDDRPQAHTHFRIRRTPAVGDHVYSPAQVGEAYSFPPGTDGTGVTIGFLELGGGYSSTGLEEYFRSQGVAPPTVVAVSVDGVTNAPSGDPKGPDGEVQLDLEVAGSIAPGASLVAYFAPNTDSGFLDGLSAAVHDSVRRPSVISISWGGPEDSWTAQGRSALNAVCEDAASMGITVLVAAGDGGATDGVGGGPFVVDFPASSPFVLACGGTSLKLDGSTISSEVVWNDLAAGDGATGGGVSESFPRPAYQSSPPVPAAPNGFGGRGVPDVAGNADPATGYSVTVDGTSAVYGGTSAVAPLWAGLVARLNQSRGSSLGFVNPALYHAPANAACRDIISGNNGGYSAGVGWDACTGWGSPDGTRLLAAFSAAPPLG
ncbi:MAG: S53 family peptidase [Thermoplasmata archaeon]|nr:S53 family peptidase [Thermoplasmata archaeon]